VLTLLLQPSSLTVKIDRIQMRESPADLITCEAFLTVSARPLCRGSESNVGAILVIPKVATKNEELSFHYGHNTNRFHARTERLANDLYSVFFCVLVFRKPRRCLCKSYEAEREKFSMLKSSSIIQYTNKTAVEKAPEMQGSSCVRTDGFLIQCVRFESARHRKSMRCGLISKVVAGGPASCVAESKSISLTLS
jgi:hypothetical protein